MGKKHPIGFFAVAVSLTLLSAGEVLRARPIIPPSLDQTTADLINDLGDTDLHVRQRAAEALGELGPKARVAIPALIEALHIDVVGMPVEKYAEGFNAQDAVEQALAQLGEASVAPLIRALRAADPLHRMELERALARVGKPAVKPLVKELAERRSGVREDAVSALGLMGTEARPAIPELQKMLKDPDRHVRISAALALYRLTGQVGASIRVLVGAIQDEQSTAFSALMALWEMGSDAAPAVDAVAKSLAKKPPRKGNAAQPEIPSKEDLALEAANRSRDRCTAIDVLGVMGASVANKSVLFLIAAISDDDKRVRWTTADALGKLGDAAKAAVPALMQLLKDPDKNVRLAAARAIARIAPASAEAQATVMPWLEDNDAGSRIAACSLLAHSDALSEKTVPALIELLENRSEVIRENAIGTLFEMGPRAKAAADALRQKLDDADGVMRVYAAAALAAMNDQREPSIAKIRQAMQRKDSFAPTAAKALWRLQGNGEEVVPVLVEMLGDKRFEIRGAAAIVLGEMGPTAKAAVPALAKLVRTAGHVDRSYLSYRAALRLIDRKATASVLLP
jgi:HEAT repeat protein